MAKVIFLYMLIDVTTVEGTNIIMVGDMPHVQAHGRLAEAQGKKVIAPPVAGRGFSRLEQLQLQYLYWNLTKQVPSDDYATLLQMTREVVAKIPITHDNISSVDAVATNTKPPRQINGKEPSEPTVAVRPKGTTTTGIIWTISDEVLQELHGGQVPTDAASWKALRAEIVKRCDSEGFHSGTIGVQYSKWKSSKLTPLK